MSRSMSKPKESLTDFEHDTTNVVEWRREQFRAMGCDKRLAKVLAEMTPRSDSEGVDLRDFHALIKQGCAPTTAAKILLPVDL